MARKNPLFIALGSIVLFFFILEGAGYYIGLKGRAGQRKDAAGSQLGESELKRAQEMNNSLRKKIARLSPKGIYIVIDTAQNILYLKEGPNPLLKAVVSCGSGNILQEPGGPRRWVFDTPRGGFFVKSKLRDPSWIKPDWAFIEEAEEIPKDPEDRVEEGVLGDYALGFGEGYFIHGTLYTRLLGRNVTHGCIRVGDQDLKTLFMSIPIGAKIFIY